MIIGKPRAYYWKNQVFIIRDVFDGPKSKHCEYGVLTKDGGIAWRTCVEGVAFKDIEPLLRDVENQGDDP
jgi:hypothetical protein